MFDVSAIVGAMCMPKPKDLTFEPTDVQPSDLAVSTEKAVDEASGFVSIRTGARPSITAFDPKFPLDRRVVAIDSTSVVLGYVPEGLVGAIRTPVMLKPEGKMQHAMERYGPYLVVVTNTTKMICTPTCVNSFTANRHTRGPLIREKRLIVFGIS